MLAVYSAATLKSASQFLEQRPVRWIQSAALGEDGENRECAVEWLHVFRKDPDAGQRYSEVARVVGAIGLGLRQPLSDRKRSLVGLAHLLALA